MHLNLISTFSILLPGGMVFFCWRHLEAPYKWICSIVLITALMEALSYVCMIRGKNNMPLFHLYTYIEATLIVLYYYQILSKRKIRLVYLALLGAFLAFSVISLLVKKNLYNFNSLQRSVECVWMIVLILIFYGDLFNRSYVQNLLKYPHYWMSSGFLLYFAGTFFLNIIGQIAVTSNQLGYNAYDIHSFLNIFLNIIYTIVLWMGSRVSTSEQ